MHNSLKFLSKHFNQVEVWPLIALIFFSFSHSVVGLLLGIIVLLHHQISALAVRHMASYLILWLQRSSWLAHYWLQYNTKIITPSLPCWAVVMRYDFWYAVFSFCQTWICALWADICTFRSSVQVHCSRGFMVSDATLQT